MLRAGSSEMNNWTYVFEDSLDRVELVGGTEYPSNTRGVSNWKVPSI